MIEMQNACLKLTVFSDRHFSLAIKTTTQRNCPIFTTIAAGLIDSQRVAIGHAVQRHAPAVGVLFGDGVAGVGRAGFDFHQRLVVFISGQADAAGVDQPLTA